MSKTTGTTLQFPLPGGMDAGALIDRLAQAFTIIHRERYRGRREYLDTFDWSAYRAGAAIEWRRESRQGRLVWRPLDTPDALAHAAIPARPVFATDLPSGRLRTRLARTTGIRALLPVVETRVSGERFDIVDRDEKVIVRGVVEHDIGNVPGRRQAHDLGTFLRLLPVKGYARACEDVADMAERLGLKIEKRDPLELALAAIGRQPLDCSARLDFQLEPGMRADIAMRRILRHLLGTMRANEAGMRAALDTEFLHDYRVAVRRTRSVLGQAKGVLPPDVRARFADEFRWLGTITSPTREAAPESTTATDNSSTTRPPDSSATKCSEKPPMTCASMATTPPSTAPPETSASLPGMSPDSPSPTASFAIAENESVVSYIDMPLQHASARVLKRMKRGGSGDGFLKLLEYVR